jgi:hypothetical protein
MINESVVKNRYTAVQSAHDTGKSFDMSRLMAWWIDTKPDPFVVTTAPTWKQVNSILWREARKAHRKGSLPGRINLDAEWFTDNNELVGFGRKPADYDQAAFQGIHALNVLVIIDEGSGVPKSIFDAVDSLATNRRARVVVIGNPDDPSSHFSEVCKPGSGWNVIRVSAFDTPAYTGEEVPEYLYDYLVSREWVEERKKRWGKTSPLYVAKVLGLFPDITDDTLLTPKLIREAQERDLAGIRARGRLGVDAARFGDDEFAIYRSIGGVVRHMHTTHKLDNYDGAQLIARVLQPYKGKLTARIDTVGVGSGVYDIAKRILKLPVVEYMASWKPNDREHYYNKRSEDYWNVRLMAERGELDLPEQGEDDDLISQLGSIKWKILNGKIAIETKEEMKERGMPSPNRADAAVMALAASSIHYHAPELPDDSVYDELVSDLETRAM